MEIILYRGMNSEEFDCWQMGRNLKNISWWSTDLQTAKLYSTYAVAKITLILNESERTKYENGARGNSENYRGFGTHKERPAMFSVSRDYLERNCVSRHFLFREDIIPDFLDWKNFVEELTEKEIIVFIHTFNETFGTKKIDSTTVAKENLEKFLRGYKIAKVQDNTIQAYCFV